VSNFEDEVCIISQQCKFERENNRIVAISGLGNTGNFVLLSFNLSIRILRQDGTMTELTPIQHPQLRTTFSKMEWTGAIATRPRQNDLEQFDVAFTTNQKDIEELVIGVITLEENTQFHFTRLRQIPITLGASKAFIRLLLWHDETNNSTLIITGNWRATIYYMRDKTKTILIKIFRMWNNGKLVNIPIHKDLELFGDIFDMKISGSHLVITTVLNRIARIDLNTLN